MHWSIVVCTLAVLAIACAKPAGAPDAVVATATLCAIAVEPDVILRAGEPTLTPAPPRLVACPTAFVPIATATRCSIGGVRPDIVTRAGDRTRAPGEPTLTPIATIEFPCPNTPPPLSPITLATAVTGVAR